MIRSYWEIYKRLDLIGGCFQISAGIISRPEGLFLLRFLNYIPSSFFVKGSVSTGNVPKFFLFNKGSAVLMSDGEMLVVI